MTSTKLAAFSSFLGGIVNAPVVLFLGATCLASLAATGIMMYKLQNVEDKLLELQELRVSERLLRLEMRLGPKPEAAPNLKPRAVAH
jgi:hypothetical protein